MKYCNSEDRPLPDTSFHSTLPEKRKREIVRGLVGVKRGNECERIIDSSSIGLMAYNSSV